MRVDTPAYINANNLPQKEPRFVVELSFDWDGQDVWYFTSHADAALPPGASVHHSVVTMSSVVQQTLAPDQARATIGSISFGLRDKGGAISGLFASKFAAGDSLKGRRVRVYRGYKDLAWADYVPVTQQVRGAELKGRTWSISCADVQRELRKDVFDVAVTRLAQSIGETDTTIQVVKTADFELVAHGVSYTDAPGQTVGYLKIEKEVIRYTGKTVSAFTGCTRGVMNTSPAAHTLSESQGSDVKVEEFVYIELPAVKAAYAIMTGVGLPKRWNLGISTALVDVAEFSAIGTDLYDPADDAAGIVFRFEGLTKTDGKKFIEEQIFQPLGLFAPVKRNGALGLRRLAAPLPGSGYVAELNAGNVVSIDALDLDYDAIHNWAVIQWNYDHNDKRFTRTSSGFLDTSSINAHGISEKPTTLALRGLHGRRHSEDVLQAAFDYFRNSYVGPVWRTGVVCRYGLNNVEIGDFVRLKIDELTDPFTGQPLDRVVRVDGASDDLQRGTVSLTLTGATEAATPMPATDAATALPDAFYTGAGTPLSSVLTINVVGSVGHVVANGVLTGGADMNAAGSIYYYDGDLTIDSGKTVTITNNVQIRVRGFLQVDGNIDGKGRGYAGAEPVLSGESGALGVAGYLGVTESMGGVVVSYMDIPLNNDDAVDALRSKQSAQTIGRYLAPPKLALKVSGNQITGIPSDLRGSSGGSGGNLLWKSFSRGGAGGNGGAALSVVCRGMGMGASGAIDTSGADGERMAPVDVSFIMFDLYVAPGSGAGGWPGALLVMLDGADANHPVELRTKHVSKTGITPLPLGDIYRLSGSDPYDFNPSAGAHYSYYAGMYSEASQSNALLIESLPIEIEPVDDASTTVVRPPLSIALASDEIHLLTQRDGTQVPRLLVSWVASPDVYLKGYQIQYQRSTDAAWTTVTGYADRGATSEYVIGFGEGEQVRARIRAVNRYNNESAWVATEWHTIIGKTSAPPPVDGFVVTPQSDGSHSVEVSYSNRPVDFGGLMMLVDGEVVHSKLDALDFVSPSTASPLHVAGAHAVSIVAVDTGGRVSVATSQQVVTNRPGQPVQFLVSRDADGTRRFTWQAPSASSFALAGYLLRYRLGAGQLWVDMSPAHGGLLTSSPYETNQLAAGSYTFAIVAVDVAGNQSDPAYIEVALGDPRLAGAIDIISPHLGGWPGTKSNCWVDPDSGWLEAMDAKTWDDMTTDGVTWDAWSQWTRAPLPLTYTDGVYDIGVIAKFTPLISVDYDGSVTVEVRTSNDNVSWSAWAAPAGQVTARYVQPRATVAPVANRAALMTMTMILNAEPITEDINDLSTSALAGIYRITAGHVRLPISKPFNTIKNVGITLQNVGPGWSWELINKAASPGPEIKIYNASNVLADCVIDALIRGA